MSGVFVAIVLLMSLAACNEISAELPGGEQPSDVEQEPAVKPDAGDQEADMAELVSMTEFFRLQAPSGWATAETIPGGAFIMANTDAALERYRSGGAVESGDFILNIGFLPDTLLESNELRPLDIQFGAPPDVFLRSLLPMFNPVSGTPLSDPELVSVSEVRDAGQLIVVDVDREGMILFLEVGEGVYALVSTIAAPGETGQFQDITYSIAANIEFSGAEGELYGALLGG
jgi:hypothetical protein